MTSSTSKSAVKKAAVQKTVRPKMASRKVADGPSSADESEEVAPKPTRAIRFTAEMGGEDYTVSATKYKILRAMRSINSDDDEGMSPHDVAEMFDGIVSLFWDKDGSRARVQEALEEEELDLDDFEGALKKMMALLDKETNRPLG